MRSATIVITTKDRKDELRIAIQSCLAQSAKPQVLVIDDGSTDGTSEMVRAEFPGVTLYRNEVSTGYIAQRNRGAELAAGDILFSIDDDAAFSTPHIVEQTLAEFTHPRIGAIAIPFINVRKDDVLRHRAPGNAGVYVASSYIGTAHALRRDVFLKLGGYRAHLIHQGEEGDYAIRLLAAGYVVALGRADPIHHFESPKRSSKRMSLYGRRNDILFGWHNVPLDNLPTRWLRATIGGFWHGWKIGQFWPTLQGTAWGFGSIPQFWSFRSPVSRNAYLLHRKLVPVEATPLTQIEPLLKALGGSSLASGEMFDNQDKAIQSRRVLIISTTFFPDPQVGAIRVTQWSRHLPSLGWTPLVFTRQYQMTASAEELANEVDPNVQLYLLNSSPAPFNPEPRRPSNRLKQWAKLFLSKIISGFMVPDVGIFFWRSARRQALERAKVIAPDVILSSSPAHSTHDLGRWLSRQLGIPWVADFRDVYLIDYSWRYGKLDRLNWPRHSRFERTIYEHAAAIIHAIPFHGRWARRRYPFARERIVILPNGYPAELLDPKLLPIGATRPERRVIRVVGSIDDADVLRLTEAVAQLNEEGLDLELNIIARIPGCVEKAARALGDRFIAPGYLPHRVAVGHIKGADLLVSYLSEKRAKSYQLTSKLFEFIASGRPTLEINPSPPDLRLLKEYNVPYMYFPSIQQLADQIRAMLHDQTDRSAMVKRFRLAYGRQQQTGVLAELLERLTAR